MVEAVLEPQAKLEITAQQYELVRQWVYKRAGINLGPNRQHLVQARLAKQIRAKKLTGFDEYFDLLKRDHNGAEIGDLIDAISTNTTHFFREADHFNFLGETVREQIERRKWAARDHTIRIWSAAASTGDEPYSLAMTMDYVLRDHPTITTKILATDISHSVLAKARAGRYDREKTRAIPPEMQQAYLRPVPDADPPQVEIVPQIKKLITFSYFNLMSERYPFQHGFDFIFCRNVMIYFDQETQQSVVRKMSQHLRPGGYFIVGHSESLNSIRHDLRYVRPTTYRK